MAALNPLDELLNCSVDELAINALDHILAVKSVLFLKLVLDMREFCIQ
jgi:hypothetical protein